jgi:hypothetical protein
MVRFREYINEISDFQKELKRMYGPTKPDKEYQKFEEKYSKKGFEVFFIENEKHAKASLKVLRDFRLHPRWIRSKDKKYQIIILPQKEWDIGISEEMQDKILAVLNKRGWK